ncbi:hypothetical protein [Megasphaera vaginalis (ex Bordigoni et al. 2020)]|uniref:hypothetical protein n=2 Tax=Megasphaera TaxID=906 RepID=UPI000C7AC6B3|nr:hypothetical protein [Megasphaera vaginalis (ex Bordigoni et al. 2020)]
MQTIHYVMADPSGNTTILVLDRIDRADHSVVAAKLLASEALEAEQVAYLTMDPADGTALRIDMMGGEFCGNASRSAAAYALSLTREDKGMYRVSCSGCTVPLGVAVERKGDVFQAVIDMPLPESVEAVLIPVNDLPYRFFKVTLPGIVHFVYFVQTGDNVDKEIYWQALREYVSTDAYAAYGLIIVDTQALTMVPAVYVAETDTRYWERSCGSGSAAAAAALACVGRRNVACTLRQPGGAIAIAAKVDDGELQSLRIGGTVALSAVQTVLIE